MILFNFSAECKLIFKCNDKINDLHSTSFFSFLCSDYQFQVCENVCFFLRSYTLYNQWNIQNRYSKYTE